MAAVKQLVSEIAAAKEAAAAGPDLLATFDAAIMATDDRRLRLALSLELMRLRRSTLS